MSESISPLAGKVARPVGPAGRAPPVTAYFTGHPDPATPAQRVSFGTSGHRGSAFDHRFNEADVLAISQAICQHRHQTGIDEPLFAGSGSISVRANLVTELKNSGRSGCQRQLRRSEAPVQYGRTDGGCQLEDAARTGNPRRRRPADRARPDQPDRGDRHAACRGDHRAQGRRIKAALQMARLATVRTLTGFDFSFQPSLDRNRIMALAGLDFIDRHEVVHFIGQSGTGKTHLASALGVEAIRAGRSVYFWPLADIIDSLAKADREGRLRERIRYLCRAQLLIIDEIGYLVLGATADNLFFQLGNARYERGAMILTSNRGFSEWAEVFGDPVVATALLDRLLHHAVVVQMEGASYRLRQHADLFPEAMRQSPLAAASSAEAPRRRGRPPKLRAP